MNMCGWVMRLGVESTFSVQIESASPFTIYVTVFYTTSYRSSFVFVFIYYFIFIYFIVSFI